MTRGDAPGPAALTVVITVSILAVSTAAILIRLSDAGPMAIAFHRLLFATALVAPVAWWRERGTLATLSRREFLVLAVAGVLLAAHFATWITSLGLTTVTASLILVTSHPVLVALASIPLGERLTAGGWAGIGLALAGAVVIVVADTTAEGTHTLVGDLLAFAGAVFIAGYFLVARRVRQRLPLLTYVTVTYAVATVALAGAVAATGEPFGGYAVREYGLFLALAVVPMIFGHTFLNWALRYVPASIVSTSVLGEPVGGTILALVVLGEVAPPLVLAGSALVLTGIPLVARGQAPPRPQGAPRAAPRAPEGDA